ncbi:MAG: hypothetical protein HKN78_01455 [Sphingomonadaceae bacterium]|nr:hypothetical protein [Sphingomonadaceae bacterium]
MKQARFFPAIVSSSLMLVAACATTEEQLNTGYVTNFAECAADGGNPILEGNPRRCLHNNQYFVDGR